MFRKSGAYNTTRRNCNSGLWHNSKIGDLVHCDNCIGTVSGFIKQIKEFRDDFVIVGTSYMDERKDFTFEAYTIYGVVTEAFCKLSGKRVYCRNEVQLTEKGGE